MLFVAWSVLADDVVSVAGIKRGSTTTVPRHVFSVHQEEKDRYIYDMDTVLFIPGDQLIFCSSLGSCKIENVLCRPCTVTLTYQSDEKVDGVS